MLVLTLLLAGCAGTAPVAGTTPPPAPVHVEVAAPTALDRVQSAVGVVVAVDSVEIRPEMSGLVQAVGFTDGQAVHRGAVLVRLRDAEAQAGLLDARSRAKLAALGLTRARDLFGRGDMAQVDVDQAEASDGLARAAVQRAEEMVRRTVIVAPFDGVAGRRDVSVGQTVDPGLVLTRIEALGHLAVDITLPESAMAGLQPGLAAHVQVPALGEGELDATVSYVASRVREDSRTVDVRLLLDSAPGLRPGMSATARIVTAHVDDALLVPAQAVVPSASGMALWVVGEDGTVSLHPVVTGERTADRVEATTGLSAGEKVVVEGLSRLRPGAKVTIVAEPSGPPSQP